MEFNNCVRFGICRLNHFSNSYIMKYWIFYVVLLTLLFSCGSRKTDTDISKQSSQVNQEQSTKQEEKTEEKNKSEKTEENKNDITDKETVKTTTTEFGPDGKPTKQTITETQRDRTDKSANNKREVSEKTISHYKRMLIYNTITKTLIIKQKSKQTSTISIYAYLFWILSAFNVVYFGLKIIKDRK